MKKILLLRNAFLYAALFCTTWIWIVSISGISEVPKKVSEQSCVSLTYSQIFDDFCGNFTRNVNSDLYLNYTSTATAFETHSRAALLFSTAETVKFHFAVNSAPKNFRARRAIRSTWKKLFQNDSCAKLASLLFYVGKTSDRTVATWLEREFRQHRDDMVFLSFCDAYENLSLKTYNMMRFINEKFPTIDYVVKIDDDVYPNVPLFLQCFNKVRDGISGLFGLVTIDRVPDHGGKYQVSPGRYANSTFPPFTHGPAYVVKRKDLPTLLRNAETTPILNLEDVWFTGIVAEKANVQRQNVTRFLQVYRKAKEFDLDVRKAMKKALFFHRITGTTAHKIWAKYPQHCNNANDTSYCEDYRFDQTNKP